MSEPARVATPAALAARLAPVLARMVDVLAWPLLLIDASASLQHANLAARRLLERGQPLQLDAQNRLQPQQRRHRAAFAAGLAAAAQGQSLVLRWPSRAGIVSARLQPLPQGQAAPAWLLLALSAPAGPACQIDDFAQAHGLTRTETRVLHCLARGLSAPRTAAALGVAVSTTRSHIVALRRKTGLRSVGALLHSLAQLPPTLGAGEGGK